MKIEQSSVLKLKISDINGLDPVSVFLEDFESGKGKITISCYDKSWNSYWGGMGKRNIKDFFLSCDNNYLAKNLSSESTSINDYETLGKQIKEHFKKQYDEGDEDAIDIYQKIDQLGDDQESWNFWLWHDDNIMSDIFGCEWWNVIPTKENPRYKYLCLIIDAVKEGLRLMDS